MVDEATSRSLFVADVDDENREEKNAEDSPRCCRGLAGGDECAAAAATADGESEANVRRKYEMKENESSLCSTVVLAAADTRACANSSARAKSEALRCALDELIAAASVKNKACEVAGCLTTERLDASAVEKK